MIARSGLLGLTLVAACAGARPAATPPVAAPPGSIDDDLAFLRRDGDVIVLGTATGGSVVVSPRWQGRVMTSAVEPHGASLGFVHRAFLDKHVTGTAFDNPGGEDRFWLGPEGGQYGLYFPPGASFAMGAWQVPHALQEGAWAVAEHDDRHVVMRHAMTVTNWSGTRFELEVERSVKLLDEREVAGRFGFSPPPASRWVAYETVNKVTNVGPTAWTEAGGLLSIWILGMYAPAADAHVYVPFDPKGPGPVERDDYFGKVPPERLAVHDEGWLSFVADGHQRGKIGLPAPRARDVMGSYSPAAGLLTLVHTVRPEKPAHGYVCSLWETQREPYAGDVLNAYNDGPTAPGQPSLGGFYEMETSSPALALAPGEAASHVHATLHVVGAREDVEGMARAVLGVPNP